MNSGHEKFKEQLPAYVLGALGPAEQSDLKHHLDGCAECRAELEWLAPATAVLAEDVEQVEPSPGLRHRVMAAIDDDLATNPLPEEPLVVTPRAGSRERRERSGWLSGLLRPATLGAIALALFVGAMVGIALDDGGSDSPSSPPRQVVTGSSTIGAQAVMVASDGTGTLKMTGLERPGNDQVYQAWIQRGQDVEPTDSLFVPRRDGTATASIPDLNGVTAVMVSAEPEGGSDQPTTAPVITVSMPG